MEGIEKYPQYFWPFNHQAFLLAFSLMSILSIFILYNSIKKIPFDLDHPIKRNRSILVPHFHAFSSLTKFQLEPILDIFLYGVTWTTWALTVTWSQKDLSIQPFSGIRMGLLFFLMLFICGFLMAVIGVENGINCTILFFSTIGGLFFGNALGGGSILVYFPLIFIISFFITLILALIFVPLTTMLGFIPAQLLAEISYVKLRRGGILPALGILFLEICIMGLLIYIIGFRLDPFLLFLILLYFTPVGLGLGMGYPFLTLFAADKEEKVYV